MRQRPQATLNGTETRSPFFRNSTSDLNSTISPVISCPMTIPTGAVLTVHTRRALVGAALGIGMRQNIVTAELVVQGVEPIASFRLRFRVRPRTVCWSEPQILVE